MSEGQVTLRTRKFIRNPLLGRKQMVVDVLHPSRPNVSKDELRTKLSELYKSGKDQVSVFGFRTHYGGGKSTGFALIYDSNEAMKSFEPHYRLVRTAWRTRSRRPADSSASRGRTARRSSAVRPRPRVLQGQEEIRVCWLLALRWLHDGRGWRIWQTVLWLSWLVCLHDLVRKRYQHGVHHAMGVTHRSYQ